MSTRGSSQESSLKPHWFRKAPQGISWGGERLECSSLNRCLQLCHRELRAMLQLSGLHRVSQGALPTHYPSAFLLTQYLPLTHHLLTEWGLAVLTRHPSLCSGNSSATYHPPSHYPPTSVSLPTQSTQDSQKSSLLGIRGFKTKIRTAPSWTQIRGSGNLLLQG